MGLVVLTMRSGDGQIFGAMGAGASAFVGKDATRKEVLSAARHAAVSPRTFLCSNLAGAMMRRSPDDRPRLSEREQEVLSPLAEGLRTAPIAVRLYMNQPTAKHHIEQTHQTPGPTQRPTPRLTAPRIKLTTH